LTRALCASIIGGMSDKQRRPRRKTKKSAAEPSPTAMGPQRLEEAKPPEREWVIAIVFEDGSSEVRTTHASRAHSAVQQVMRPSREGSLACRAHVLVNPVQADAIEHTEYVVVPEDDIVALVVDRLRETGKLHSGDFTVAHMRENGKVRWVFEQWHDGPRESQDG
jgi:hypothetical protein